MTKNDIGHWQRVDAESVPQVQYVPMETLPQGGFTQQSLSSGIILDQKVLVGLVLILGFLAGITLILVLDRYNTKK
jgi:hypothetical protein